MKSYNELIEILKEKIDGVNFFAYEDYDPKELGLGEIEEIEQEGGEGQGDHWHSVKYFKDHDVYVKVVGYYSSYEGANFDGWADCYEVKPTEKTITVYESL